MFVMHIAEMLGLIAMALGLMVVMCACQHSGKGVVKFIGWLIVLFAIGSVACTSYCMYQYWRSGYFEMPHAQMMQGNAIMNTLGSDQSPMNKSTKAKNMQHKAQ